MNTFTQAALINSDKRTTDWGEKVYGPAGISPFVKLMNMLNKLETEQSEKDFYSMLEEAWEENPLWTLRLMFYIRDVRGGAKMKRQFALGLKLLTDKSPSTLIKVLEHIPFYGSWMDITKLYMATHNPSVKEAILTLVNAQLSEDIASNEPSLCAKWLPSASQRTKTERGKAMHAFMKDIVRSRYDVYNVQTKTVYRKLLTALRKQIKIVETKISKGEWSGIDYSKIPGGALQKYRKAFQRHNPTAWAEFVSAAEKGEVKVNSKTNDITDLVTLAMRGNKLANGMWLNQDKPSNGMVPVVDRSASMYGYDAEEPSVGLGILFAEANKGAFENLVFAFAENPTALKLSGDFIDKVNQLYKAPVGYTTNLNRLFDLYIDTAKRYNVQIEDLPSGLVLLSDMEVGMSDDGIDWYSYRKNSDNFELKQRVATVLEKAQGKFEDAGIPMPHIVFHKLSNNDKFMATQLHQNVTIVSGNSPEAIRFVTAGEGPLDLVKRIVEDERYARLTL